MNEFTFGFPEVCLDEDYIIATYFIETNTKDVTKYAVAIADEQTTGTWVEVPGETNKVKIKHGGKVTGIFEIPDYEFEVPKDVTHRKFIMQVAFPTANFNPQIPMLLTSVIGNIANAGRLKLLDLYFPKKFVQGFKGPKFGIEGLRELTGVKDRPFINNMVKPCTGWTPPEGAAMCYEVARGGTDIIKDDELLAADLDFCPLVDRVKAIMAALKKADEEKGEMTLYTVNITDNVWKMREHAKRAIEAGANALMMNFYTVGFSAAQEICEDPDINVPILAHVDFSGAMFGSPYHGISSPIFMGKLARMAGADMAIITSPYGKFPVVMNKYEMQVNNARMPLFGMRKLLPCISGGTTQGSIPHIVKTCGIDVCVAAGGAIHGHPMGARAGSMSMRQAIDASLKGVSLRDYAKDHKELAAIVDTWGAEDVSQMFALRG